MANADPFSKGSRTLGRRQTFIRRKVRSEDDTPQLVQLSPQSTLPMTTDALSPQINDAVNPAPSLPSVDGRRLPPPAPLPLVRGQLSYDDKLRSFDGHRLKWHDRAAAIGLAVLVALMIYAMWHIMNS